MGVVVAMPGPVGKTVLPPVLLVESRPEGAPAAMPERVRALAFEAAAPADEASAQRAQRFIEAGWEDEAQAMEFLTGRRRPR
jgi:hypothetical protein